MSLDDSYGIDGPPDVSRYLHEIDWKDLFESGIQDMDPLGADALIAELPARNNAGDVAALLADLKTLCPEDLDTGAFSTAQSIAATRDIGIYLGSIKRHEVEPEAELPHVATKLQELAQRTALPPRDNLMHYTLFNPTGARQRRYTALNEETVLVDVVRACYYPVFNAIHHLRDLLMLSVKSAEFSTVAMKALGAMYALVPAITQAKKMVSPVVFGQKLRPYFEPVRIAGAEHKGPGAVELPLFMIDHLIWSGNEADPVLRGFQETYLGDQLPAIRQIYEDRRDVPCLVDLMQTELRGVDISSDPLLQHNHSAVVAMVNVLLRFRGPHTTMANEAYESEETDYEKGSGGFQPTVVTHLLRKTQGAAERLKTLADPACAPGHAVPQARPGRAQQSGVTA